MAEAQVHGGRDERLRLGPHRLGVVPRHAGVGVVHVQHEAHGHVPHQEGQRETGADQHPGRLARSKGQCHQHADPGHAEGRHQQAIAHEDRAARRHLALAGEEQLAPPDLDQVVQARAETGAVDALQRAAPARQRVEFFQRVGRPDEVEAFQVGIAVVDHVMADFPQAVRRQRRQEGQPAQPFVQAAARRQALVAGIVADDEQARDHQPGQHAQRQLGGPVRGQYHAGQHGGEQQVVEGEQRQRARSAALAQRDQPAADDLARREWRVRGDRLGQRQPARPGGLPGLRGMLGMR
ncbi:hypothetical protein FQZ97_784730 [compost metagenome]